MMFKRTFIAGSLVFILTLLAVSFVDVSAQIDHETCSVPANGEYEEYLGYLSTDTDVSITLFNASLPIRIFVFSQDYFDEGSKKKELAVDNVVSGNWSLTVSSARDYYLFFFNDNSEPVLVEYSVEMDYVDIFDETMLMPVFGMMVFAICLSLAVTILMTVGIIIIIIIGVRMATKVDKKADSHDKSHPPKDYYGHYYYYPGYYQEEEIPRKKKGKRKGKKRTK
jgi:hypothetical protein